MASASVAIAPQPHYHHSDMMQDTQPGDKSRSPERLVLRYAKSRLSRSPRIDSSFSPKSNGRSPPKMVIIKKESSPEPPRHRPTKLNLSKTGSNHAPSSTPRTAMTMREVGMACLSPGLNVTDDLMREQLERSMGVRDQQRQIIETRLQRNVGGSKDDHGEPSAGFSAARGKRKPIGGLSIVPPHHNQFANERIIHSAPLNQSFTVRRGLAEARADRMTNRLPPIADVVFGPDVGDREREREHDRPQLSSQLRQPEQRSFFPPPPINSSRPDYPSPMQLDKPEKSRDFKSADETIASMAGGREDLLPRLVHYGGHQPPTPPSPTQGAMGHSSKRISSLGHSSMKTKTTTLTIPASAHEVVGTKRRRTRGEFDRDDSTGSENDPEAQEAKRRKKERFLALCAEAWDLLQS
ncbi:hypothetical protein ABW21_db0206098 [Orbilia brochopaga]|nr:hypothetical protein ABW21_db0206098 [Drechslerella brochopaga]